MPIRRADCGGATAATITTSDSSTSNGEAAAVAKTTTGKSPVSSCTSYRDVVLGLGHGGATILIRSSIAKSRDIRKTVVRSTQGVVEKK
ncbi:hypothetical protein K0M31_001278 [Melipona bicolor]|uniref:Uncharacterized protein n=1 Tax=Melipona bicolor TaxID=60889 RepID=A0AA40GFE5_9HYME|nr:hypothetical protein K0M31_001278 [Melipona bicolor]